MKRERLTPGMVQRREWEQPWTERVPKELLVIGQLYREVIRLVVEEKGPSHDPVADWESLYKRQGVTDLTGLLCVLAPDRSELPSPPTDDQELSVDDWVKRVVRYIGHLDGKAQSCSPQMQAQLTTHARDHLSGLRREIRTCFDTVAALVLFQTHPAVLLEKARSGDFEALEQLLQLNPSLEDQPWVRERLGALVRSRGLSGSGRWHRAITHGLQIRKKKLLELGCLLTLLWPFVCRLTTDQRRGYLKALGVTAVPTKNALREFERRLHLNAVMETPLDI